MYEAIKAVLDEEVKPLLGMHGGGVELVEVTDDGVVRVRLTGACAGCPGAMMTLTQVVETAIRAKVPDIKEVEAVF